MNDTFENHEQAAIAYAQSLRENSPAKPTYTDRLYTGRVMISEDSSFPYPELTFLGFAYHFFRDAVFLEEIREILKMNFLVKMGMRRMTYYDPDGKVK